MIAADTLIEKIRQLPPEKAAAVEDFVDFLRERDSERAFVRGISKLSEESFRRIWDNPEDAAYDQL